ncbi:hypothetical protein CS369_10700 [Candidatus Symbiopectobacterium sp. 'North America']|nr:hypothetical protein [Candidatus Symbiopectobacterium sp. 'North America']
MIASATGFQRHRIIVGAPDATLGQRQTLGVKTRGKRRAIEGERDNIIREALGQYGGELMAVVVRGITADQR